MDHSSTGIERAGSPPRSRQIDAGYWPDPENEITRVFEVLEQQCTQRMLAITAATSVPRERLPLLNLS